MKSMGLWSGNKTEYNEVNVLQAYEPYRVQIRGLLFLIVVAMAFVYIAKLVIGYATTSVESDVVSDLKNNKD